MNIETLKHLITERLNYYGLKVVEVYESANFYNINEKELFIIHATTFDPRHNEDLHPVNAVNEICLDIAKNIENSNFVKDLVQNKNTEIQELKDQINVLNEINLNLSRKIGE